MTLILSGTDGLSDVDGSASTPAIRGTDTNTGIFFPAADTIAFTEGGAEAMRIDSSGNVLVGTTTSLATGITTSISSNAETGITINNANTGTSAYVNYRVGNNNNSNRGGFALFGSGYTTSTIYRQDGILAYSVGAGGFTINAGGANPIYFATNDTERMRIDSSGNVGIGTTLSNSGLSVAKAAASSGIFVYESSDSGSLPASLRLYRSRGTSLSSPTALSSGNGAGTITFGGYNSSSYAEGAAIIAYANQNWTAAAQGTFLTFHTTSDGSTAIAERARITSGGYFKASNDGSYVSSTGSYHELVSNDASNQTFYVYNSSGSFVETIFRPASNRSATNLYSFLIAYSAWTGSADIEFNFRGDGNAYADGTFNNNGADYAEFFESANGQELTLGATVVLDGNKVREATEQDPASAIIGVVRPKEPSKASMVVGNTAWNKWANKYLTDDFDRYIMEDHDVVEWEEQVLEKEAVAAIEAVVDEEGNEVSPAVPAQEAVYKTKSHSYESHNIPEGITVPADAVRKTHDSKGNKFQHYKLNPAWDKDAEYVNRENRPEWNIIGLVGQVKVLKGQPTNDRWVKMRDVSATVEEWFIR